MHVNLRYFLLGVGTQKIDANQIIQTYILNEIIIENKRKKLLYMISGYCNVILKLCLCKDLVK